MAQTPAGCLNLWVNSREGGEAPWFASTLRIEKNLATRRILASERTLDVCVKDPCEEIAIYSTTDGCRSIETCMGDTPVAGQSRVVD